MYIYIYGEVRGVIFKGKLLLEMFFFSFVAPTGNV